MPLFLAIPAFAADCVNEYQAQTIAANLATNPLETSSVTTLETCGGDDSSYQVPLTTTVTFDGIEYNSVYATTNSVITFGTPDGTYWDYPQTPSISLYSMDWVVYPNQRADEHLIIATSDGGFQIDISARPIWLQNTLDVTNIVITAAINSDGTVSISYAISGPQYDGQTRTGVRLVGGSVVTLDEYGIAKVEVAPELTPEPVIATPEPEATPTATPEPTPTPEPTVEPTPEPTPVPPVVDPGPIFPETYLYTTVNEGNLLVLTAPTGYKIDQVIFASYGTPSDYIIGSCHATESLSIIQSHILEDTLSISADNGVFGDPCGGTYKRLSVVLSTSLLPEIIPVEPTPTPTVEPVQPTPEPTIEPVPEPTYNPEPIPTPAPEPEPTLEPLPPGPELPITPEPPAEIEPAPEPAPMPEPTEEPVPEVKAPLPLAEASEAVKELAEIAPEELTDEQAVVLLAAAELVLETAIDGSPEYEAALDALAVVAQADDVALPEALANIPGAAAVLDTLNALGNMGADMSPATREEAEKIIVAGVVAVNVALGAISVPSAPSAPAGGSSGGPAASGSGSAGRKE